MKPSRVVALMLATVATALMAAREVDQDGLPVAADQPPVAGRSAAQVALVPVALPLSGSADEMVMASATKALKSLSSGDTRGVIIFEFRARDGESIGTTGFERALSLARFLASEQFSRVRTVAYVPVSLDGHAILPVLACEEIVIAPDAEFGAAGRGERTIDATMRAAYCEIAERRRTVPVPIVLGMLDPQLTVIEAQLVGGGTRYVLSDDLAALRSSVEVWKENTIAPPGDMLVISGRKLRVQYGFASHLAADRKELAEALQIAPESIREDVVVRQAWTAIQIDVRGRINARMVDDVTRSIRDIQRKETANLICLQIDSPGGPAAPALDLVHLIAGLDSQKLRTIAFVDGEARSVAALIALAADETYAREDALFGGPGDSIIGQDELAAMRQPIQELAQIRNRDWSLLLGLVDPQLEVFRCTREGTGAVRYFCEEERTSRPQADEWNRDNQLKLQEGITAIQAKEFGLIVDCADSLGDALGQYNIQEEIAVAQQNSVVTAIEQLATQAWFARTLLFIAFFALISEASAPGIGVAGFASGLCFLLFFWCQFLNGTAGYLELLLFMGGLACIALEIFVIPGFGVFGVGGGIMVLLSIVLASQTFIFPRNTYQMNQVPGSLMTMVVACGGVMSAIWFMRRFLADSWLFHRLMLSPPSEETDLDHLEATVHWEHLAGKRGVTTTQLTPSGKASFGDDVVNVISDGLWVPIGTVVRVAQVQGNRVLVEPLEET